MLSDALTAREFRVRGKYYMVEMLLEEEGEFDLESTRRRRRDPRQKGLNDVQLFDMVPLDSIE